MASYPGTFNDGLTAARRDVAVTLDAGGLRIAEPEGPEVAVWPYEELRLVEEVLSGRPLRLKRGVAGAARLSVADHRLLAELGPRAPGLRARDRARIGGLGLAAAGLAGIALLAGVLWVALPWAARMAAAAIPVSWEEALGDQARDQLVEVFSMLGDKAPRFCEDAGGGAALERLVARLAAVSETPYRFRVEVLDIDVPNAFALPGGRIVLFQGLIESAEAPEEVAGVLAHEMGHVTHRHATQIMLQTLGVSALFDLMLGDAGVMGGVGETLLRLSYTREAEAEADTAALDLLSGAGIRSDGLSRFFQRMSEDQGDMSGPFQILSTHPSSEARARLFAEAGGAGGPGMSADDWRALRGFCPE